MVTLIPYFFGYDTRAEAEKVWGQKFKHVTYEDIRIATPGKGYAGSVDGMTFHYTDGSEDQGILVKQGRVTFPSFIISWIENVPTD